MHIIDFLRIFLFLLLFIKIIFKEKIDLLDYYPSCRNEKLGIDKNILFIPKSFCFVSQKPFFSLHSKILLFLFKKTIRNKHYEYLSNKNVNDYTVQVPEYFLNEYKSLISKYKEKKAEILWHDRFQEISQKYKNDNKFININEAKLLEFYLSFFYEIPYTSDEYTLYRFSGIGRKEENDSLEYISNRNAEFNLNNYRVLFKKFKNKENLFKLLSFILLEKQIIIFGEDSNEVVSVLEAMLDLILPM